VSRGLLKGSAPPKFNDWDGPKTVPMDLKSNLPEELQLLSRRIHEKLAGDLKMNSRLHVAILDDDQSVRTALGRLLNASDMEAEAFATGVELFSSFASKGKPDCLVLDLQMPGMNGLDVLNYLREMNLRVPTVVITAHDEPGACEACIKAGAALHLRKPLDANTLLAAIEKAVASPAR
jgi:FixJ family two-component response regulator